MIIAIQVSIILYLLISAVSLLLLMISSIKMIKEERTIAKSSHEKLFS